jgi:hypothetical protein
LTQVRICMSEFYPRAHPEYILYRVLEYGA